jgi:hypothetical protein
MEDLIKQAFKHVEDSGPHVQAGHYDLFGTNGETILPVVWKKVVQPGWQIHMRMRPMDKSLAADEQAMSEQEMRLKGSLPPTAESQLQDTLERMPLLEQSVYLQRL